MTGGLRWGIGSPTARVATNPVPERIHGKSGDLIFRRHHDGTVVGRGPAALTDHHTPAQEAVRKRLNLATVYGRAAMAAVATQ